MPSLDKTHLRKYYYMCPFWRWLSVYQEIKLEPNSNLHVKNLAQCRAVLCKNWTELFS